MSCTSFRFSVTQENDGSTLRTFLRRSCGITARSMTLLKNIGGIYRGDALIKARDTVSAGDVITLRLPEEENEIIPTEGELCVLYEDEYLLIVNKPAAMPVHPTKSHQRDTLANIVSSYQQSRGERYVFRAMNRLDKDTSGCVVIAKDRLTYALVIDSIRKSYVAVCEGAIHTGGTIDQPIGLADNSKMKRSVRPDGCPAVTHYRPLKSGNGHTLLELRLETGRTHQIRCHMSWLGHPLAGDDLYGGSRELILRQALHCQTVTLYHPIDKNEITVTTDVPDEFMQIIKEG